MKIKAYKVSAIVDYVKELLEDDMLLCSILIRGEISNFRRTAAGHMYFSINDENASLRCCMFKNEAAALEFMPRNGDMVRIYGRVSVYKKAGDLQFIAELMEVVGDGEIARDLAALRQNLHERGIFDNARPIPNFPDKIAVVTSPTGAAVFDIIKTIQRRNPMVSVVVIPTVVQGELSPASIAQSIELANTHSGADVVIVGRGGGSAEDLRAFNTELVACAVHGSQLPVISAVGHEIDYTLCDFAADLRAVTPTAAAELATQTTMSSLHYRFSHDAEMLTNALLERLEGAKRRLSGNAARLTPSLHRRIARANADLTTKVNILNKVSPQAVLERGFVLALDNNGNTITDGGSLAVGQKIRLQFADAERDAKIE